jgi:hypothetical protein
MLYGYAWPTCIPAELYYKKKKKKKKRGSQPVLGISDPEKKNQNRRCIRVPTASGHTERIKDGADARAAAFETIRIEPLFLPQCIV